MRFSLCYCADPIGLCVVQQFYLQPCKHQFVARYMQPQKHLIFLAQKHSVLVFLNSAWIPDLNKVLLLLIVMRWMYILKIQSGAWNRIKCVCVMHVINDKTVECDSRGHSSVCVCDCMNACTGKAQTQPANTINVGTENHKKQ